MQITRQTEYAIRTLLELAGAPPGTMLQTRYISQRQQVPELFLKKTVQLLARAGLVTTRRGSGGGVVLNVPPHQLTLADILVAVEGKLALNVCLAPGDACPNSPACPVRSILQRAQEALVRELSRETLADIVGIMKGNAP